MANPRVFISSTYYDLKYVRDDIRQFILSMGYEPVMHDKGGVAYTQTETLEQSCYNELTNCDIVVCIIGNKYGTESQGGDYSITMQELRTAIKEQKKIYIYIQKDVSIENHTYIANKDNGGFIPVFADNIKIHEFISEIKETLSTHPISQFDNITDITNDLKRQFAGLFQRLLQDSSTVTEAKTYYDLAQISQNLRELSDRISEDHADFIYKQQSAILRPNYFTNHLCSLLGVGDYIVFLRDVKSLKTFLSDFAYYPLSEESLNSALFDEHSDSYIWAQTNFDDLDRYLFIKRKYFDPEGLNDDNRLKFLNTKKEAESILTLDLEQPAEFDENDVPF